MKTYRFTLISSFLTLALSTPAFAARPDQPKSDRLITSCQNALSLKLRERRSMPVVRLNDRRRPDEVMVILAHHPSNPGHTVYSINRVLRSLAREPKGMYSLLGDEHIESVKVLSDEDFKELTRAENVLGHVEVSFDDHENREPRYQGRNALKVGDVITRDSRYFVVLDGAEAGRTHGFVEESLGQHRYGVVEFDAEPRPEMSSTRAKTLLITEFDGPSDDDTRLVGYAELAGTFEVVNARLKLEAVVRSFTPRPPEPPTSRILRLGNFRAK